MIEKVTYDVNMLVTLCKLPTLSLDNFSNSKVVELTLRTEKKKLKKEKDSSENERSPLNSLP